MERRGNLELRLGYDYYAASRSQALYASSLYNGKTVYKAPSELVKFLDSVKNPSHEQFETWFREMSHALFPGQHYNNVLAGQGDEVIMDIPRKLLLFSHSDKYPVVLADSLIDLRKKHDYQILMFTNK